MANTIQDELYKTFVTVSGQQTSALSDVTATLADVLSQVHEMQAAIPSPNVKSSTSTSAATTQPQSSGPTLSSVASTVLTSGFGLAPLVSGLVSLFSGGAPAAPAPLVKYALPSAVNFQAAQTASGISGLDYDQTGMARSYGTGSIAGPRTSPAPGSNAPSSGGTTSSGDSTRLAPQITVSVQAMDARSFLDRSNDIALAVRDAMLNMNAINDVVAEL